MKAFYWVLLLVGYTLALEGQVVDEKGVPVAGVSVEVVNQSKFTTTDSLGQFSFENLVSIQVPLLDNQLQFQKDLLLLNLKESSLVKLTWLNSKGQKLATLSQDYPKGQHTLSLKNLSPQSQGIFFLDVQINQKSIQAQYAEGQFKKVFSKA